MNSQYSNYTKWEESYLHRNSESLLHTSESNMIKSVSGLLTDLIKVTHLYEQKEGEGTRESLKVQTGKKCMF